MPFGRRHLLLGHPVPPRSSAPLTIGLPGLPGPDPDGVSTFRAPETRPGWAPPIPRGQAVFTRPTLGLGRRLPPLPAARPYHPGLPFRRPGLTITRHQQGFTCVHPSGLPLARLFPRTERGPLGFFLELRTPHRQDPQGARRGGDRSRTLIRNHASGIPGLQSACSLEMRDLVSHPSVGGRAGPARVRNSASRRSWSPAGRSRTVDRPRCGW